MSYSKVSISNLALAKIGAEAIRSFSENNTRARMCDAIFDSTRDQLLTKFDWPFARGYQTLQELTNVDLAPGERAFGLPSDCLIPRAIYPKGHKIPWEIRGKQLIVPSALTEVSLYFTRREVNTSAFSDGFVGALSHKIAVVICPSLTRDPKLSELLNSQMSYMEAEAWEADANMDNEHIAADARPVDDTFVNPGGDTYDATEDVPWGAIWPTTD